MATENPLTELDMSAFQPDSTTEMIASLNESMLTLGQLEAMSADEQSAYWLKWEALRDGDCTACDPSGLGESGISEILCKIWKFVLGIAKAVVDGVAGVLVDLSKAVYSVLKPLFEMIGDLAEGIFSSPGLLMLAGAALVIYMVMKDDKDEPDPVVTYGYRGDGRYDNLS